MLTDAFKDCDIGIGIRYRTDGTLFNFRRLQTKTKVMTDIIRDFLFAGDCALNVGSEADMQRSVDKLSYAYCIDSTPSQTKTTVGWRKRAQPSADYTPVKRGQCITVTP